MQRPKSFTAKAKTRNLQTTTLLTYTRQITAWMGGKAFEIWDTETGVLRPAYCGLLGLPINSKPCEWGRGGRGQ